MTTPESQPLFIGFDVADKLTDSYTVFSVRCGPYLTEELERVYGSEGAPQGLQPWLTLNRQNAPIRRTKVSINRGDAHARKSKV